jgi:hypothetical protein
MRSHLEVLARHSPVARAALEGPEGPEALDYLHEWAVSLLGRSGVGMDGYAPLGYATVAAWAQLMAITVAPHEVEALMMLDAVMRHPGDADPAED